MASLVAGLLIVINCDRVTHVDRVAELGGSWHGFPLVYLKRQLEEVPMIFIHGRTYSWPYPPVSGEVRDLNLQNLALDILIGIFAVVATYWLFSAIVFRYDNWKYNR